MGTHQSASRQDARVSVRKQHHQRVRPPMALRALLQSPPLQRASMPVMPAKAGKMGPLEAFACRFKSRANECEDDIDGLSSTLDHARLSPRPSKPLPALPSPPPMQHSQERPSKAMTRPPSQGNAAHYHQQTAEQSRPFTPIPSPYLLQALRPHSVSIDHLAQPLFPNPWELSAPVPPSSLPTSLLAPPRPVSAPVLASVKPAAKRSRAIVVDPLQPPGVHQCWGIKRDGTRCTRRVGAASSNSRARTGSKSPSPKKTHALAGAGGSTGNAIVLSDSEDGWSDCGSQDDERREFCHQHSREINKTSGFVLPGLRKASSKGKARAVMGGGEGAYVDFDSYLGQVGEPGDGGVENCRARLRTAMCQSPSDVDWIERGYIYIYEVSRHGQ